MRGRCWVETPAGAQAQADWYEFRLVMLAGRARALYAFGLKLSFSRSPAFVWSPRADQIAWHHVHNQALPRFGEVPAVIRIDNLNTGISRGAGPWGTINRQYHRYADSVGFQIDACLPNAPQAKGKIERLLHHSHVLNIKGRSYRLRKLETALAASI